MQFLMQLRINSSAVYSLVCWACSTFFGIAICLAQDPSTTSKATVLASRTIRTEMVTSSQEKKELETVAEKSGFTATCRHDELLEFQKKLAERSEHITNKVIGQTVNGRAMQATFVANPPFQAGDRTDKRLVVLLLGNIHSGECAGKEGLLMLLRELALDPKHPWLKNLVVVCLPNYNADGNDRIGRNEIHRPGQAGPSDGMGLRENAQQLDLNRDFMKLESPEAKALVKLMNELNPHLFIDCHTTNGSRHRYQLTYDIPHNPTSPLSLREFMRNEMMPAITEELDEQGIPTFYYGNFSRDQSRWTTYGHEPRYSTEYFGLRGRLSVLSEAYSYLDYEGRIIASREFVRACVDYVSENRDAVRQLLDQIENRSRTTEGELSLAAEVQPFEKKFLLKGYDGQSETPKDVEVEFFGKYVATKSRKIPSGYLLHPKYGRVVDRLLMHGVEVHRLVSESERVVDEFKIENRNWGREFQKHKMLRLEGDWFQVNRPIQKGFYYISTRQPLGRLAAYLLEPESNDGFVTWNFFDSSIELDATFPVLAVRDDIPKSDLQKTEKVEAKRKLTLDEVYGPTGKIDFGGRLIDDLKWTDSNRYQTNWNGRNVVVDAETGALSRSTDLSKRQIVTKLMNRLGLGLADANEIADGDKTVFSRGVILNGQKDLYWVSSHTDDAKRLTRNDLEEELVTASPNGKEIAYVRANNLYRLSLDSGNETQVTDSGSEEILNGKLDWVYQEELFGRGNFKGYWWSHDSSSLAYLILDQSEVKRYRVTNHLPTTQSHEVYPYPKAGDPNPKVAIAVDGKKLDLKEFGYKEPLISQVCWSPTGEVVFQLQNRIQNQLNLVSWKPGNSPTVLVQQSVEKGWLDSPGNPIWVDGLEGFIWFTHRTGRRQISQYSSEGKLLDSDQSLTIPTDSLIEVRELVGATSDRVYFMAPDPKDLTRMQLWELAKGGATKKVTSSGFNHEVVCNDRFTYFFDYASQIGQPTRVALRRMDGTFVRFVDPNLVDHLDYYEMVSPTFQQVPTRDGKQLDSMLILPPNFDESKKYPVIMHVYAGPQAPRVRNRWSGASYLWHQMMAQQGFVIWMCDNRSATYRGLDASYPIYGDLGRRELEDIEDSLSWLKSNEWVDADRIGIWGWSYGGYMTAYAMTHSKSFKVGISGAPVTDWRNYDSIYTERYMGLPALNAKGYDSSSVVNAAESLHGKMLLIHGTQDDNVHISNTLQLVNALQLAGKQFDLMMYPRNRHGIRVPEQVRHLRQLMTRYFLENL